MALNSQQIVQTLLTVRNRLTASVWLIVRDAQTAEDIFQEVSVKALAADLHFDREPQLVSWAQIAASPGPQLGSRSSKSGRHAR